MNRGWKIFVRITMVFALLFVGLYGSEDTFAWIGTGEGGSSSSSHTGSSLGSCDDYNLWMYAVDCAGVSWIYYEAQSETNNDTVFPALESELTNVSNVSIPGECSKRGGGFWHFGINSFGVYVDGDGLYTGGYYGHWTTMNSGHYVTTWAPYKTANLNGKQLQSFGVYKMEKYGAYQDALKAYQQAYLYENPGATAPTEIPGRVWGFCWNPDMENTGFKGTSRVLAENRGWNEVADNKKKQLSGADSKVEWYPKSGKKNGGPETLVVEDCNLESGCEVYFRHYLKRDGGEDLTQYWIKRTRNGVQEYEKSDTDDGKHDNNLLAWESVTIKPGEKVCETLEFYSDGSKKTSKASSTICAVAVAEVGANISARIRDEESVNTAWGDRAYAKPGDEVEIEGSYEPFYQSMYNVSLPNSDKTIGQAFDSANNPKWNNAFNIKIEDNCGSKYSGNVGNASMYSGTHTYTVQEDDAGKEKQAWAVTNCEESAKTTPKKVSVKYSDANGFSSEVDTNAIESNAVKMVVPYNFENSVAISSENSDIVYAGETVDIRYELSLDGKTNSLTSPSAKYSTKVPDASWGLKVKYGDGEYEYLETHDGDLSGNGKVSDESVNISDLPAGTQFCVQAWLWPVSSGSDDNTNKNAFGDEIAEATKCFTIAKKPSFQAWGGDIYVGNGVADSDVPIAVKNLSGGTRVFGSWGELGVETSGSNGIMNLASGAGLGYESGYNDRFLGGYTLDGTSFDFCDVSTLTFPKGACGSSNKGNDDIVSVESLVGEIENKVNKDAPGDSGLNLELNGEASFYTWQNGNGGGFYKSNSNITINGNIERSLDATYTYLNGVPRYVIYGKNIDISCEVSRIDAILIAAENIDTCVDSSDDSTGDTLDAHRHTWGIYGNKPLMVNGAMIAGGTIYFNRTYGAGPGNDSIEPGEIINYDPTWYVWNKGTTVSESEGSNGLFTSNLMVPVYTRELAPRY